MMTYRVTLFAMELIQVVRGLKDYRGRRLDEVVLYYELLCMLCYFIKILWFLFLCGGITVGLFRYMHLYKKL